MKLIAEALNTQRKQTTKKLLTNLGQPQIILLEFGRSSLDGDRGPVNKAVIVHHRPALERQVSIAVGAGRRWRWARPHIKPLEAVG